MKTKIVAIFDALSTVIFYAIIGGFLYLLLVIRQISYLLATAPALLVTVWLYSKEKKFGSKMPGVVRFLVLLMIAMHVFGYVLELYSNVNLWDKAGHIVGGLAIGSATVIVAMTHAARQKFTMRRSTVIFLSTIVALGVGTIWEIIEFAIDQAGILNFSVLSGQQNLQWGNTDTMLDILLNGLGGLMTGIGAVLFVDKDLSEKALSPFVSEYLERRGRA